MAGKQEVGVGNIVNQIVAILEEQEYRSKFIVFYSYSAFNVARCVFALLEKSKQKLIQHHQSRKDATWYFPDSTQIEWIHPARNTVSLRGSGGDIIFIQTYLQSLNLFQQSWDDIVKNVIVPGILCNAQVFLLRSTEIEKITKDNFKQIFPSFKEIFPSFKEDLANEKKLKDEI